MILTKKELEELNRLRNKSVHGIKLSSYELSRMLELINKSEGNIFNNYLKDLGYSSIEEYRHDAEKDNNLINGILFIIGAILVVDLIDKFINKKK